MIIESIERPPSEIVQGFKDLLSYDSITCAISDCMGRFNAMTSDMRPLFEGIRLVGTAVTVKTLAADLAAAFKAIDVCQPGDIVVVDGNGVVVVPKAEAAVILQKAQRLLKTEHLLQEKIKAGATIGELVKIDDVFKAAFSYQSKAVERD